jgi:hypothetical protein
MLTINETNSAPVRFDKERADLQRIKITERKESQ